MTPYERVMKRLNGKPVDKIPNMNIVMTFAAKLIGVPYSKYVTDYNNLVAGNIKCAEEFGIDILSVISCPTREAQDLGAGVNMPFDGVPAITEPLINDYDELDKIRVIDPEDGIRMKDRIEAVKLYKREAGGQYPILGWIEGCVAEGADLRGINDFMFDIIEEPEFTIDLMERVLEQQKLFAEAQVRAGADIIGVGDAASSIIGPKLYKDIAMPFQKRLCDYIHSLGCKVKLHICGNIEPLLGDIRNVGADMVDIDHMVDFQKAVDTFKGTISCACGNMDPVEIMMRGDTRRVTTDVQRCINASDETTFIAGGCEIPKDTPPENMRTMNKLLFN